MDALTRTTPKTYYMIKQIIEKYQEWERDTDGRRIGQVVRNIPALEQELEQEMEKRAVAFAAWVSQKNYSSRDGENWRTLFTNKTVATSPELYARFKFEHWAEREGYVKDGAGWMNTPMIQCTDADLFELYTQFKQEAK